MALDDKAIIAEFVVESLEHLADVENELLTIESGGANVDSELVNKVFRAVHSIKGAAGFFGFTTAQELAHELENVLNLVRNRQLVPTSGVTDVLLKAADKLRAVVEDIENSNEVDASTHVTELRAVATGQPVVRHSPASDATVAQTPPAEAREVEQELASVEDLVSQAVAPAPDAAPVDVPVVANVAESLPPAASAAEPAAGRAPAAKSTAGGPAPETNIRVSVRVLDHLMNLAGELVLARNQLVQAVAAKERGNLEAISSRLNQVTSEIQEAIMQTRLQVVETVFSKFPRIVRDLSATLSKECELHVEGEDVELDKSIIEGIGDPLTHLIRNSVDHGIETPAARTKAGKSPKGRIVLKAFHQAGKVNIAVSDDGGGIDAVKLKAKAVSRGIITAEQAHDMSEREALRLIFKPGFSMAEKVTNVSGRGVGMDVVKTNIERLGGTVDVDTQLGSGTTINISLPLTLAIIPSLIVRCGTRRFAIPQASISELVRINARDAAAKIERVNSAEVFRLRGDLLPLVRLSSVLTQEFEGGERSSEASAGEIVNIIVLDVGHLRYGLIVDGLHDSEEIVVKPLGKHIKGCSYLAGATILGDGQVALILDTAGIAAASSLTARDNEELEELARSSVGKGEETQNLLLFTNAPEEQFGIPMELIARLERIRGDQVDSVGGQEVLQYRGTSLPLLCLERHIKAGPRPERDRLYVVVYKVLQKEIGMIIPDILDIRGVTTRIDMEYFREPGVIGSLVLDGKVTRLLDLFELTRAARPEWFPNLPASATHSFASAGDPSATHADTVRPGMILLAEDSDFFRKQLQTFLEGDGYEVVACEDGQVAWNVLCEPERQFDLVVTDLEMPNLNGLELARKIKGNPALAHLPVIAVTSLASDEDIERGKKVGIDEYLIKLDRERLAAAVSSHLRAARQAAESQHSRETMGLRK